MERKTKQSVDGFVPRGQLGGKPRNKAYGGAPVLTFREPPKKQVGSKLAETEVDSIALKKELQDSLRDLGTGHDNDFTDLERSPKVVKKVPKVSRLQSKLDRKNKKRARKGKRKLTPKQFRVRRFFKTVLILILLAVVGYGGYFAYNAIKAAGGIFDGSIFGFFHEQELMRDENGRTNILVFGTEPEDHDGSDLTDAIIILSMSQDDNSVYMISLPRDLYIKHIYADGVTTTRGKINEIYFYGKLQSIKRHGNEDDKRDDKAGAAELKRAVTDVTGLNVQYYVHLSWDSVLQVTDALGGIEVKIDSDDPRGLYDPATGVRYAQGEIAHLNGEKALALVRSRGAFGGYGFSSSNFARERNQQAVLRGMQQKALSGGTLANPQTAIDLMNALGDTLRTDFQTSEVRTLVRVARDINPDEIISIPLLDPKNGIMYVTTDMIDGISFVVSTAGLGNFTEIRRYIRDVIFAEGWEKERAVVDVLNGSGVTGFAKAKAQQVQAEGFKVGDIDTAPTNDYIGITIYKVNNNSPATAKKLMEVYGVEVKDISEADEVITPSAQADFIIIFGR